MVGTGWVNLVKIFLKEISPLRLLLTAVEMTPFL